MWDLIALSPQLRLACSDIYLKLLSTKKIDCNWAYKTDGGLKLTTVTIINLNFTSGEKNAWSSISARKAGFLLSHVSCSIVLTCRAFFSPDLFIYLLHLYKPLCFFLPKQTRNPSLSNLFFFSPLVKHKIIKSLQHLIHNQHWDTNKTTEVQKKKISLITII